LGVVTKARHVATSAHQRLVLRVGSRASALARAQTDEVVANLAQLYPNALFEVMPIATSGDRSQSTDAPTPDWGTGVFVREIEAALMCGEIDLAVHSLKDLPPELPAQLCLAAVPRRADPWDVLVTTDGRGFDDLAEGALVGTTSTRRSAFLKAARPDLRFAPVRGNVDTRCRKLRAGQFDALVLARAGLERLSADARWAAIESSVLLPAPGQGALAVQTRADDRDAQRLLARLDHAATRTAVTAERRAMAELQGGCRLPVAALGTVDATDELRLQVAVAAPDGSQVLRAEGVGPTADPDGLAVRLASQLRSAGADRLLGREALSR
jgi:hydroxymethylbilane synthase